MIKTFIAVVVKCKDGRNRWIVSVNDNDPETIGETVFCGMPGPAKDFPVGTKFQTTLTIPNESVGS